MTEMYPNPNAEPNSNFKKIPLNSKLWRDSSFDEVSIVIIYGGDSDSEVYIGMWEAREDFFEEDSDDEGFPSSIQLIAPHKLSEVSCRTCGAKWLEGQPHCEKCGQRMRKGETWIRQGESGGMVYTQFDANYIEAIYTPKRNVDISTAMEMWLME